MARESEPISKLIAAKRGGVSRRTLLGMAAGSVAGVVGAAMYTGRRAEGVHGAEATEPVRQESLEARKSGFEYAYTRLKRDEILFLGEDGAPLIVPEVPDEIPPITNPLKLEPFTVVDQDEQEVVISPGEFDAHGFLIDVPRQPDLNQEWIDEARRRIAGRTGTPFVEGEQPRQLNVIKILRDAYDADRRREERQRRANPAYVRTEPLFEAETFMDIVKFHGAQQRAELGGKSLFEYIRENVRGATHIRGARTAVPELLLARLESFLPALVAQESQGNPDALSAVGAVGAFQIMPGTWRTFERRMGEQLDRTSLADQLKVAGAHLADSYDHVLLDMKDAEGRDRENSYLNRIKKRFFGDDGALFEEYFLFPAMINSYNTGTAIFMDMIQWAVEHYVPLLPHDATIDPKDVFVTLACAAARSSHPLVRRYKKDSSEYVVRIAALEPHVAKL
ncbi:lytic transglycosylase domain-containing protein [Candidatus Parcubacteria bacterium]|nr:lytic transglycosylase domain-containing protein [Candidatus Parcubacteria bacterium]